MTQKNFEKIETDILFGARSVALKRINMVIADKSLRTSDILNAVVICIPRLDLVGELDFEEGFLQCSECDSIHSSHDIKNSVCPECRIDSMKDIFVLHSLNIGYDDVKGRVFLLD